MAQWSSPQGIWAQPHMPCPLPEPLYPSQDKDPCLPIPQGTSNIRLFCEAEFYTKGLRIARAERGLQPRAGKGWGPNIWFQFLKFTGCAGPQPSKIGLASYHWRGRLMLVPLGFMLGLCVCIPAPLWVLFVSPCLCLCAPCSPFRPSLSFSPLFLLKSSSVSENLLGFLPCSQSFWSNFQSLKTETSLPLCPQQRT